MVEPSIPEQGRPDPSRETTAQLDRGLVAERDYVEGKIAVLHERLDRIDKATELLSETVNRLPTDVQLEVGHLKALTEEKFGGVDKVLDEQRRGMEVAEREREKAAGALRVELARAIEEGDTALRDHVEAQVAQIHASLVSADLLEQERTGRIDERVGAERRVNELTRQLSDLAISKAEAASTKQFDTVVREVADMRRAVAAMTEQLAAKL